MDNPYQTPAAAVAGPVAGPTQFKEASTLTAATRLFLVAGAAVSAAAIFSAINQRFLLQQVQRGDLGYEEAYDQLALQLMLIGLPQIAVSLGGVVIIAMWIHRMAWNARALAGAGKLDYTPGWAVGWYFVPFANLWKPYQAMKQIWQASHDPQRPERVDVSGVLPLWWLLWIVSCIIGNLSARMALKADTVDEEIAAAMAGIVSDAINIPLCLVFLLIVNRLFQAQTRQHRHRQAVLAN